MSGDPQINLCADVSLIDSMIIEMKASSEKWPEELRQEIFQRIQSLSDIASFKRIESAAIRAGYFLYVLQPSKAFLELYFAVVSGNHDFFRVEVDAHGSPFHEKV